MPELCQAAGMLAHTVPELEPEQRERLAKGAIDHTSAVADVHAAVKAALKTLADTAPLAAQASDADLANVGAQLSRTAAQAGAPPEVARAVRRIATVNTDCGSADTTVGLSTPLAPELACRPAPSSSLALGPGYTHGGIQTSSEVAAAHVSVSATAATLRDAVEKYARAARAAGGALPPTVAAPARKFCLYGDMALPKDLEAAGSQVAKHALAEVDTDSGKKFLRLKLDYSTHKAAVLGPKRS